MYYSFSENNYSVVDTPDTTLEMIDQLNNEYEIDFPAADFFYPTFTDDLINHFKTIRYLGKSMVNGKEHFHIAADNEELNIQMWIANDSFMLPSRFAIIYKKKNGQPQYYASMSEWNINPNLPEQMFEFVPPVEAKEINMMAAKTTNP